MARELKEGQVYVVDGGLYDNCLCVVISKGYSPAEPYVSVRMIEQGAVQTKNITKGLTEEEVSLVYDELTGYSLSLYAWRLTKFLGWLEDKENT